MSEATRIAEQMRRMVFGQAWHGPSLSEALADIPFTSAIAHPIKGAHSIWEIVNHLVFTQEVVSRRLDGEDLRPTEEEYWPSLEEPSEEAWKELVSRLLSQETELSVRVALLKDTKILQAIMLEASTIYETLHGHIQHNAYHAGQIKLLFRAQE